MMTTTITIKTRTTLVVMLQLQRLTFWNRNSTLKRIDLSEVEAEDAPEPKPTEPKGNRLGDGK